MLSKKHFLDWPEDKVTEVKNGILQQVTQQLDLDIKDIIVSGSRVVFRSHPVFKDTSDLDSAVLIDEGQFNELFGNDALFQVDAMNKISSRFNAFMIDDVKVSVFVRPLKLNLKGEFNNLFHRYNISYYSLLTDTLYRGDTIDEVDYYTHIKPRLEKHSFCYLCKEFKYSPYIIELGMRHHLDRMMPDTLHAPKQGYLYLCESCAEIIGRDIKQLRSTLSAYKLVHNRGGR